MADARDRWWIIGSAAVALHGGSPVEVADVDVLCSVLDARAVIERFGMVAIGGCDDPLFRSTVFARWDAPPLHVELMADFHVRSGGEWRRVSPSTREFVAAGETLVPAPSRAELIELLLMIGRKKDVGRAALLR